MIKNKVLFFFPVLLLSACAAGQAAPISLPIQATEAGAPLETQPTAASVHAIMKETDVPATETVLPVATFTPKPPLEEGAWMHMPAAHASGNGW